MIRGRQWLLIVLALMFSTTAPAAAQEKTSIRFSISHVEDRYALNLPVFRDIFQFFDFGYAGCSVEVEVTAKGAKASPDANPKIQLDYTVRLGPGMPSYKDEVNGSITRRSVPIYLKNKCAEVSNIKIVGVKCFNGFKGQWGYLTCPYDFGVGDFAIPDYYDRDQ
jgi:hypothetical protein